MNQYEIENIIYSGDYWDGTVRLYRTYGSEFIVWLSEKTALPLWMICLLIITSLIFISVKIADKLFIKEKCSGKHYFWTGTFILSISFLGLFAPNITNILEYLTQDVSLEVVMNLPPKWLVALYEYGYDGIDFFMYNAFDCSVYYFTAATALLSIGILIKNRKEKDLDFFTELGFWLSITSAALLLLICIIFIAVPIVWYFGCFILTGVLKIHGLYYPIASLCVWLAFAIPQMLIKLEVVIKCFILVFVAIICIRSMNKIG